jgi:two-component system, sensor histidine kinase LadS
MTFTYKLFRPGFFQYFGMRAFRPMLRLLMAGLCTSLLLGALLALTSVEARARTVLDLDTRTQPVPLQDWGDYLIDPTGELTADQVSGGVDRPWQPTHPEAIYPVTTGSAVWVRFTVPPAPDDERWYLEVPYPAIDRASLFTRDGANLWREQRAGDLVAVSQWPVPHRHPLLPIALSAEQPTSYLLRLKNGHAFRAPLQFISEGRLSASEQRISLILGLFFGLAGLAALVSALSAVSLRDSAYGFFALSVTLLGLTQASLTGIAGLHLWPNSPWWNNLAPTMLPLLTTSATLLFVSAAVALPVRWRGLHRFIVGLAVLGVLVAAALLWLPVAWRRDIFVPVLWSLRLGGLLVLAWAWRRGDRFAPWLLLAYLPVYAASSWTLAANMGLAPLGFFTRYGMQLGVSLHLPVVMLVLMLRSQHRRENTRRIHGLDRVDPATGLINAHVFAQRLLRTMARSERLNQQSAVLLIELTNVEQIQRDFGGKAADELPLRVAERLLSITRVIDSAARLSDRQFGMLMEGPFSAEEAASLGPRIVARCLMPFDRLHVDCVAQVRVVYALVPYRGVDAEDLLELLEDRLAAVPANSKRAVFALGDTSTGVSLRTSGLRKTA